MSWTYPKSLHIKLETRQKQRVRKEKNECIFFNEMSRNSSN